MLKWLPGAIAAILVPVLAAQWTPAPGQGGDYPQTQSPANPPGNADYSDQPDPADLQHGVARLSIVQGDVNIRRGDNGVLSGAVMNAPLLTHDHLATSPGSRAEIQFDAGTVLRAASDTEMNFADVQYQRAQVQLGLGTIIFRMLPGAATQVEIDTPSIGIRALTQGEYRISVFDDGTSEITVRSGQLELSGPRGSEHLDAGRSVLIRGDSSDPQMQTIAEAVPDQFDSWSQDRDHELNVPQSNQYVSGDVQGISDLDQYGNWVPSGYGQVWRPRGVASDWSPYSNGQWSYVDYYGWSWIDYSPWGWAPYHYGRWFWNTGYGWCWWSGGRGYRSYWSPALVGFFGFGGRVGVGIGSLGWVALAPHEPCYRWWGRGGGGFGGGYRGYNGFRGGAGIGYYRNASIRGGAMTGSFNSFGIPRQRFSPATRSQITQGSVFNGRIPVQAGNRFNYSDRRPVENNRLAGAESRTFFHQGQAPRSFASSPSSPAYRTPPAQPGRNWNSSRMPSTFSNRSVAPSAANDGWKSFGRPSAGSNSFVPNQSSSESGWHRFGNPPKASQRSSFPGYQQRPYVQQSAPRSFSQPYQQQPRSYQSPAPRQNFAQPSGGQPHYSAPSGSQGGGGNRGGSAGGGGSSHGGGGSSHHGR